MTELKDFRKYFGGVEFVRTETLQDGRIHLNVGPKNVEDHGVSIVFNSHKDYRDFLDDRCNREEERCR